MKRGIGFECIETSHSAETTKALRTFSKLYQTSHDLCKAIEGIDRTEHITLLARDGGQLGLVIHAPLNFGNLEPRQRQLDGRKDL